MAIKPGFDTGNEAGIAYGIGPPASVGTTFSVTIFGLTSSGPIGNRRCRAERGAATRPLPRPGIPALAGRALTPLLLLAAVLMSGLASHTAPAAAREGQSGPFQVAATIKPVHSLVAAIMRGVGQPVLVFPTASAAYRGGAMPARMAGKLKEMDLIFRIGPSFEERLNQSVADKADGKVISLMRAAGVRLLDVRPGHRRVGAPRVRPKASNRRTRARNGKKIKRGRITFRTRNGRKVITTQRRKKGARRPAARRSSGRRNATQKTDVAQPDPNIWLDPRNAIAMARAISKVLILRDPGNARLYRRNVAALIVSLEALEADITGLLRPLRTSRFAVLNNRLQYFEENFLLRPAAELKLDLTGLTDEKAAAIGKQLKGGSMRCILAPTAASPARFQAMQPGGDRRLYAIDPYGDAFDAGPDMYETMMRAVGESYGRCLALGMKPKKARKKNGDAAKARDPKASTK